MSRGHSGKPRLTLDEHRGILQHVGRHPRTLTLYTLAVRLGLGARRLSSLNLGDVTSDGRTVGFSPTAIPTGSKPDQDLVATIERYLVWRCACSHHRIRLRTYRDPRGIERCHACHDDLQLQANPLFVSRWHLRLSPRQMRYEFTKHRDALGFNQGLTFESLCLPAETGHPARK